jgi:hypothetical protein
MRKHTYTRELAPTNTGSMTRPARFNMRQTCEVHARTTKLFLETKAALGFSKDKTFADIWEEALLPLCEHALWHMRESPSALKSLVRSMYKPLPKEDYVRARYKELKARLEPSAKAVQVELAI